MNPSVARDKDTAPAAAEEAAFSFDELFFSRTDGAGIILSGNKVFQRVSMYSWDELLRKPHKIIRHPDMPAAVFWLLWDTIKRGEPIGAYVKNRAKDGRHYWVFAIVTPIDGGYLSVRLKPSSPIFAAVKPEYTALAAAEKKDQLKPADAAARLLGRLAELGFKDYGAFMSHALSLEIAARDEHLGRPRDNAIQFFSGLVAAAQALLNQAGAIFAAYATSKYMPLNLHVQAAGLGEAGATLSMISENYSTISNEIRKGMDEFMASAERVRKTVNDGLFLICVARMQREVLGLFNSEAAGSDGTSRQEMEYLEQQQETYQQKAIDSLHAINRHVEIFHQAYADMKRLTAGLEVVRVLGKVETSHLKVNNNGLSGLMADLGSFQASIAAGLKEIDETNGHLQHNIRRLLRLTQAKAGKNAAFGD